MSTCLPVSITVNPFHSERYIVVNVSFSCLHIWTFWSLRIHVYYICARLRVHAQWCSLTLQWQVSYHKPVRWLLCCRAILAKYLVLNTSFKTDSTSNPCFVWLICFVSCILVSWALYGLNSLQTAFELCRFRWKTFRLVQQQLTGFRMF